MPSPRPPSIASACLRCQLGQIIFGTSYRVRTFPVCRNTRLIARNLHTTLPRSQGSGAGDEQGEAFIRTNRNNERRRMIYNREFPLGKVVGQPGRRQREGSETLKIDSMNQPFDVVLMQDIPEPKKKQPERDIDSIHTRRDGAAINAAEITSELLEDRPPNQDEVNESIDTLRPNSGIVEREQFDRLLKQLSEGYTTSQLSQYLLKSPTLSSADNEEQPTPSKRSLDGSNISRISRWRPGRTPLEKRHTSSSTSKKIVKKRKKMRIAEEILVHKWDLTVQSEAQQIGEIEIPLKAWQHKYLFDLRSANKPRYAAVIQPPLLLRQAEILSYRPDNILRIVARRQDAEEIAGQIVNDITGVKKLTLDLTVFKQMLGQPWWPKTLREVLPDSDLEYVGQHTMTVIERRDEREIVTYNQSWTASQQAKRLLLSLLKLPSPVDVTVIDETEALKETKDAKKDRDRVLLPESAVYDLSSRQHGFHLARLSLATHRLASESMVPSSNSSEPVPEPDQVKNALANYVSKKLLAVDLRKDNAIHRSESSSESTEHLSADDYWQASSKLSTSPWYAQFCRILQPSGPTNNKHNATSTRRKISKIESKLSMVQPGVTGIITLLSYFAPRVQMMGASKTAPYLIAHFFPSPFTPGGLQRMPKLPRIELRYDFVNGNSTARLHEANMLQLSSMTAILYQREYHLPLPHEQVDLRMVQRRYLQANLARVFEDEEIDKFTRTLSRSASRGDTTLNGESVLKIKLPQWVAETAGLNTPRASSSGLVEVEYCLERFEQVQVAEFTPVRPDGFTQPFDPRLQRVLDDVPKSSVLEYRDVEGGLTGGSRVELTLRDDVPTDLDSRDHEAGVQSGDSRFVKAALGLAACLTRIHTGELQPLRTLHGLDMGSS